ncbi:hypothetical protein [Flavobacterium sp. WC2416]|uniref:BHLH domain-containing protein n=1 Tax=Flavobacterium sp. WC2416 TaxID=3234141 RepID=A0AB39W961_9FLAO
MTTRAKTGGRSKNTPNKVNAKARELVLKTINDEILNLPQLLTELKAVDRANLLVKMLQYVLPKQSKIELDAEITDRFQPVVIQINEPLKLEK